MEKRSAENQVFMGFFTIGNTGENEMKEDYKFFGIRKNPDPDHTPEIKYEQIISRSDAELLAWICTTGYDEAMKAWEEEDQQESDR